MKSKRMERQKWIKNNSFNDPPWSDCVKNMLNSTISRSYPDVVIGMQNIRCLWSIQSNWWQRWWSTIIRRIAFGGWLITITANHSNYLVCDRANTQSVTVESGKSATSITANALVLYRIYNIVLFEEERGMFILHHFCTGCICSFLTLVSDFAFQWPVLVANSWTPF